MVPEKINLTYQLYVLVYFIPYILRERHHCRIKSERIKA